MNRNRGDSLYYCDTCYECNECPLYGQFQCLPFRDTFTVLSSHKGIRVCNNANDDFIALGRGFVSPIKFNNTEFRRNCNTH